MKVQNSRRTNRIPSNRGRESFSPASWITARYDVIEAPQASAVQPGVQEAKWGLALRNQVVIPQRQCGCRSLYTGHQLGEREWTTTVDGGLRGEGEDPPAPLHLCPPREGGANCTRGKGGRGTGALWQGCMRSPPPHLGFRTAVYPRSEHVVNAAHTDKSGGYVEKRGGLGGHAMRSGAGGRGVHVRTPFGSAPHLQAGGEWGVAPCTHDKQGAKTIWSVYKTKETWQRGEG